MNGARALPRLLALPRLIAMASSALVATAGWACAQETPRAPNGKADLTGTWTSRSLTPLERPDSQPALVISREAADKIEGRVAEFRRTGELESLTQIANPAALEVCGPTELIKPSTLTLPLKDAAELERVEGMLVRFNQPLVVSGNFTLGRFGELVLSPQSRLYHPNNHPELSPAAARLRSAPAPRVLSHGMEVRTPVPWRSCRTRGQTQPPA